jgi:two-component system NtrC family sensor kinase
MPIEAGGIYNWLVSRGTPLLITDARQDSRLDSGLMTSLGVRTLMAVPLWCADRVAAVLTVSNKRGGGAFDGRDLRLLTVFSDLAGAALQNAVLYADLKRQVEELHSTQRQLLHSTRLAAIGELAANLAHEINNPLTSVLGYTSHLLKTLDLPDEDREKLRLVERETLRVRRIIRNLLDFSRQRPSWMRPGDLLQPLRETVALVQGVAERASVRIIEDYPPAPVMVSMDHNELKQVFLNIMNNALQSMPDGGELQVRAFAARAGEAAVEIRDSGHGIAREHLEKIFEPFFSTKNGRDGTGLGLSISQRIIQNHGGRIDVESESDRGTVFRVVLPAAELHAVRA